MTPFSPSPMTVVPSAWSQRLVEQLQQLSELTETLTYRLLELEERVAAGERELLELRQQADGGAAELPEAMEDWLQLTEQRLGRVEELLQHAPLSASEVAGPSGRNLMAVEERAELADPADSQDYEVDPFPEEEEQDFLDEQVA